MDHCAHAVEMPEARFAGQTGGAVGASHSIALAAKIPAPIRSSGPACGRVLASVTGSGSMAPQ